MIRRSMLVVLAALALFIGACGGDDGGGGTATGEAAENGGDGGGGGGLQITASGTAFDTDSLSAPAGELEVTLTNEDGTTHTFTIDDLDVNLEVEGGNSDSTSFEAEAGTYEYHCRFHSSMTGELTVE
jgi:plastocyanin